MCLLFAYVTGLGTSERWPGVQLVDPAIEQLCTVDQVLGCIHVGLLCVEERAVDRPNMSDII